MDHNPQKALALEQIRLCCKALDDKKAEDLKILNVEGRSPITDYLVIGTGTSEPHLKALRNEIEKTMQQHRIHISGEDRETGSGWVVIDAFDFVIHLFTREKREFYRLESLWKDAEAVSLGRLAAALSA